MPLSDLEVAIAAVHAGSEVAARSYGWPQELSPKAGGDVVTRVDLESEAAILDVLTHHRPEDARTSEESGTSGVDGARRHWLVDPLCGTLNFAAGTPLAAVNVALQVNGVTTTAACGDPVAGETFWTDGTAAARRHAGGDDPLLPTAASALVEVNCDGPADRPFLGAQLLRDATLRASFAPRVISSTLAVAWVAAGRRAAYVSDGSFDQNIHFAAGIAICRAAGCVVSDLAGDALGTGRGLLVGADIATHEKLLAIVEPHLRAVLDHG